MTTDINGHNGFFVAIDGPSGVGKSTIVTMIDAIHKLWPRSGDEQQRWLITYEPTNSALGQLARAGTGEYHGLALACLVAADRYHHLDTTIRPALAGGKVVVCARYLPTSLVLQTADGVPEETVWLLHQHADRPHLTIILTGDPDISHHRATERGTYSRFHHHDPQAAADELRRYLAVAAKLEQAGWPTVVFDVDGKTPRQAAREIIDLIQADIAASDPSGD